MGIFDQSAQPAGAGGISDFFTTSAPLTGEIEVNVTPRAARIGDEHSLTQLGLAGLEPVRSTTNPEAGTFAWLTTEPVELSVWWPRLVQAFPVSGWWPMIVPTENQMLDFIRDGELDGPIAVPEGEWLLEGAQLAPGSRPEQVLTIQYPVREHLLLVPVTRPADALAAIGWNVVNDGSLDIAELTLALRSWEERFGTVVGEMGPASLMLDVTAPPEGVEAQHALLVELEEVCPEIFEDAEPEDLLDTAANGPWMLWWD